MKFEFHSVWKSPVYDISAKALKAILKVEGCSLIMSSMRNVWRMVNREGQVIARIFKVEE